VLHRSCGQKLKTLLIKKIDKLLANLTTNHVLYLTIVETDGYQFKTGHPAISKG